MAEPRITMFEALAVEAELSLAAVEVIAERRAVTEALETTRVQAIEAAARRGTLAEVERFARPQAPNAPLPQSAQSGNAAKSVLAGVARQARLSLILEILFYAGLEGYQAGATPADGFLRLGRFRLPAPVVAEMLLELLEAKRYTVPLRDLSLFLRGVQRAGVLFEYLIPFFPKVVETERSVALELVGDILAMRLPASLNPGERATRLAEARASIERHFAQLGTIEGGTTIVDREALQVYRLEDGVVAEKLYVVSLSRMRDANGKELADHLRVFVADTPDGLEIWPIGVGESKLIDDPQRVIRQILETFPRIAAGLRAGNLDASRPVRVRWGPRVVATVMSAVAFPEGTAPVLEAGLRAALNNPALRIDLIPIAASNEAAAARDTVAALVEATQQIYFKNLGEL